MGQTFLTELNIVNTRHLHHIRIPICADKRKHLILTGKNGCGKTSILQCIDDFLNDMIQDDFSERDPHSQIADIKDRIDELYKTRDPQKDIEKERLRLHREIRDIEMETSWRWNDGCVLTANDARELRRKYSEGKFILRYFRDDRRANVDTCTNPAEMEMKQVYGSNEHPAENIGKFMANMKFVQAFIKDKKTEATEKRNRYIDDWFARFEQILQNIYENQELRLCFDEEKFRFFVKLPGREQIPLEHMSRGYTVVFDIIGDLMMRMESRKTCDLEGIVLIDEVETHLHISLQRQIMPILTSLFPNIQFILTTHSPFVLISTENAVVYDLEKGKRIEDKLAWMTYDAVVDMYFGVERIPQTLKDLFTEYRKECEKPDRDHRKIRNLERKLDKVPDFLAEDFVLIYKQYKLDHGYGSTG